MQITSFKRRYYFSDRITILGNNNIYAVLFLVTQILSNNTYFFLLLHYAQFVHFEIRF